jgi:DNA repair protein RadC
VRPVRSVVRRVEAIGPDMGAPLALGAVAALVGIAALKDRKGSFATVKELEQALQTSGSLNVAAKNTSNPRQKPWELFMSLDSADVPDELLVAILIAGTRGDPVAKARKLLSDVQGSVGQLIEGTTFEEGALTGPAKARLRASAELARRAQVRQFLTSKSGVVLTSPQDLVNFFQRVSQGPQEVLSAIYTNNKMELLGYRVLSKGSRKATIVDPVEILRNAILLRAGAFFLAHQHPSGSPLPSRPDKDSTQRLQRASKSVGVNFLDHIVIGRDGKYTSMAEEGLM